MVKWQLNVQLIGNPVCVQTCQESIKALCIFFVISTSEKNLLEVMLSQPIAVQRSNQDFDSCRASPLETITAVISQQLKGVSLTTSDILAALILIAAAQRRARNQWISSSCKKTGTVNDSLAATTTTTETTKTSGIRSHFNTWCTEIWLSWKVFASKVVVASRAQE